MCSTYLGLDLRLVACFLYFFDAMYIYKDMVWEAGQRSFAIQYTLFLSRYVHEYYGQHLRRIVQLTAMS